MLVSDKNITGKITGENDKPLPEGSIFIKGASIGTTSAERGNFSLSVPDNADGLLISFTGYAIHKVSVKGKTVFNISLKAGGVTLDEVVVGYGTQRKSDLTGSLSSVKGSDLNKLPTRSRPAG